MKKTSSPSDDLKSISSGSLQRGLSLLQLTVSTGLRVASLTAKNFLASGEKKQRVDEFLSNEAVIIVRELEKLKGSIMKAGQMLSVYGEHFLPPEVNNILKKLQSDSRPVIWSEMAKVLRAQLGDKLEQLEIETTPIAAASLGQVYRARIKATNEEIVLKIQYPGIDKAIDNDLSALKTVLALSQVIKADAGFEEIFREIRMILHYEADYARERQMIEDYRKLLEGDKRFIIPKTYEEFSSKRVLAMSFEEGKRLDDEAVAALPAGRRNRLGASILELLFREIFQWRLVQTDPHLGNYKVHIGSKADEDRVILLDFGAVRSFPKRYITPFARLVRSAVDQDMAANFKAGFELGFLREEDQDEVRNLFYRICIEAIEPFRAEFACPDFEGLEEGPNPYPWGETDLRLRLTALTKDALFAFRLRPPPREAIFLDRKMAGTFVLLSTLKLRMGPRKLLLRYLDLAAND